jgi:hypothetical protein
LNGFIWKPVNKLLKFDNAAAIVAHMDGSGAWSLGLIQQFRFFRSSKAHRRAGSAAIIISILPVALVIVLVYTRLLTMIAEALIAADGWFEAGLIAVAALALISIAFIATTISTVFSLKRT